jgi:hypothetical protein
MAEARRFAGRHTGALASHPTWLFSSGPIGEPPKPEAGTNAIAESLRAAAGAEST